MNITWGTVSLPHDQPLFLKLASPAISFILPRFCSTFCNLFYNLHMLLIHACIILSQINKLYNFNLSTLELQYILAKLWQIGSVTHKAHWGHLTAEIYWHYNTTNNLLIVHRWLHFSTSSCVPTQTIRVYKPDLQISNTHPYHLNLIPFKNGWHNARHLYI